MRHDYEALFYRLNRRLDAATRIAAGPGESSVDTFIRERDELEAQLVAERRKAQGLFEALQSINDIAGGILKAAKDGGACTLAAIVQGKVREALAAYAAPSPDTTEP